MTCDNFSEREGKPYCSAYGFVTQGKSIQECMRDYSSCFAQAKTAAPGKKITIACPRTDAGESKREAQAGSRLSPENLGCRFR